MGSRIRRPVTVTVTYIDTPLEPPEDPCDEGEGDCDGRGDGGLNDGDRGCKGDLVCGSNNCLKFGLYYHEKDDCCEKPGSTITTTTRKPHPAKPLIPAEG